MSDVRRSSHVFYRDALAEPPCIVRGKGVYVYDDQGRRYLDACSGSLVSSIGHGVEEIAEAAARQASTVAFTHLSRFTNEPLEELGSQLAQMCPGSLAMCYFVSGGSEAVESAAKFARQYYFDRDGRTGKYLLIGRRHSFHGNTLGALSMGGHGPRRRKFAPMLLPFGHIAAPYCYRCEYGLAYPGCGLECARELERAIRHAGPANVAAFIAEPVAGAAAGAFVPPPEYFRIIRDTCDRYDVLLILDEVMSGVGRTGANFAIDHWDVVPDILVTAKGLAAGYAPLGAMVLRKELHEEFGRSGGGKFVHGHTYGGNPLSAAIGSAVLRYIQEHDLVNRAGKSGNYLMKGLREAVGSHPLVGDLRGKGLMIGVELVKDKNTREPFDTELGIAERVGSLALQNSLVVFPGNGAVDGIHGDHFLIGPPLTISETEMDEVVSLVRKTLDDLERELTREIPA